MKIKHIVIAVMVMMLPAFSAWADSGQKKAKQDVIPGVAVKDTPLSNGPNAFVIGPHHNFNSVMEGTEVLHDFGIKNTGNAPLIIERVLTD